MFYSYNQICKFQDKCLFRHDENLSDVKNSKEIDSLTNNNNILKDENDKLKYQLEQLQNYMEKKKIDFTESMEKLNETIKQKDLIIQSFSETLVESESRINALNVNDSNVMDLDDEASTDNEKAELIVLAARIESLEAMKHPILTKTV